tara:strand:- start:377 stop:730 length:354 start_codon:yes stop_codon:yes gene_type:complete
MSEDVQTEVEVDPIENLIQSTLDQNFTSATKSFNDIMSVKLNDVLDQEKIKLSGQIYNGEEPDENEEEQLDLDFGDEEDAGENGSIEDSEESGSEADYETEVSDEEEEEIEYEDEEN